MPDGKTLRVCFLPGAYPIDVFGPAVLPGWEILADDQTPDIILLDTGKNIRLHHWHTLRQVWRARRRFGWRPLLVSNHAEAHPFPVTRDLDWLFSFQPSNAKNCLRIPVDGWERMERSLSDDASAEQKERRSRPRTRFCNFIYSAARYSSVKVREYFCRLLMDYKRVDCPARSLNNMPPIAPRSAGHEGMAGQQGKHPEDAPQTRRPVDAKLDFMASCKFTIAFENISTEHYLTEKIFDPLSVGSIPIYWGCRRIAEYINPACFVNCHDYASFAAAAQRVREIDQDPQLYEKYRNASPVSPDSRMYEVREEMRRRAAHIAEQALQRRKMEDRYPSLAQLGVLAARNADCVKDIFRIPRKSRWAAVRNLLSLYRESLFS